MKYLLPLLLVACGGPGLDFAPDAGVELGTTEQALGAQYLTFGVYHSSLDRQAEKLNMIDCAVMRWRVATGLPLEVSIQPAHYVKWSSPGEDYSGRTWGPFATAKINVNPDVVGDAAQCQNMTHEIGHILRRDYGHLCPRLSLSFPSTSVANSRITQCDIDAVCAVQDCQWETPEGAEVPGL